MSPTIAESGTVGKTYRRAALAGKRVGRVLTGLIVERTASRLTLQTATERLFLAPADVAEVRLSPVSMMPEGQLETLTRDQVRDLIAYLAAKTAAPR
jgi:putative heme-binding domain-containing protein